MSKCKGVFGFIFGHKFSHEVLKGSPTLTKITADMPSIYLEDVIEASKPDIGIYVYCSRCGENHHLIKES